MNKNQLAHLWLKKYKAENKVSYSKIGGYINYSDVGVSKALRNETLSLDQIIVISEELGQKDNLFQYFSNNSNSRSIDSLDDFESEEIIDYIISRREKFRNSSKIDVVVALFSNFEQQREFNKLYDKIEAYERKLKQLKKRDNNSSNS